MTDVHNKETRSYNMSQIKGKNTKPEILIRKFLFSNGFRFRLHVKDLPGKPDIVLPKHRTVIFINGCFWHGHIGCKYFKFPKTRLDWWKEKIEKTRLNDILNHKMLENMNFKVIIVWECQIKNRSIYSDLIRNIMS